MASFRRSRQCGAGGLSGDILPNAGSPAIRRAAAGYDPLFEERVFRVFKRTPFRILNVRDLTRIGDVAGGERGEQPRWNLSMMTMQSLQQSQS
jgi:hypothetical protein